MSFDALQRIADLDQDTVRRGGLRRFAETDGSSTIPTMLATKAIAPLKSQ